MSLTSIFLGKKKAEPVYDDAYWKKRREEDLATRDIVTRYVACFGNSHYDGFCGIKEIKGYYSKTFEEDAHRTRNWELTMPIFYQTDFDDSDTYYGHSIQNVFETRKAAQFYYNAECYNRIQSLERQIESLKEKIEAIKSGVK